MEALFEETKVKSAMKAPAPHDRLGRPPGPIVSADIVFSKTSSGPCLAVRDRLGATSSSFVVTATLETAKFLVTEYLAHDDLSVNFANEAVDIMAASVKCFRHGARTIGVWLGVDPDLLDGAMDDGSAASLLASDSLADVRTAIEAYYKAVRALSSDPDAQEVLGRLAEVWVELIFLGGMVKLTAENRRTSLVDHLFRTPDALVDCNGVARSCH